MIVKIEMVDDPIENSNDITFSTSKGTRLILNPDPLPSGMSLYRGFWLYNDEALIMEQLNLPEGSFQIENGSVKVLKFSNIRISTIPYPNPIFDLFDKGIGTFKELLILDLTSFPLVTLPPKIGQLHSLTELKLNMTGIRSFPPEIGQLKALTILDLSNTDFIKFPPEIIPLESLQNLSLHCMKIVSLPPEIGQLKALTTLDLSYSKITSLPPEIGQLKALTTLDLSGTKILREYKFEKYE